MSAPRILALGAAFACALALASCTKSGGETRRELTERERDSTIGASVLPGAGVVKRAMSESIRPRRAPARWTPPDSDLTNGRLPAHTAGE
jgi:hypothetical protein